MIAEQAERKLEATREEGAQDPAHRPLQGIRVVDLTHVLAGPLCTTIMADLGADVVKVERLGAGDITRQEEPFREEESCYFAALNRNKRSLALDLKRDEARLALERLVERADVLVENFRPGTLDSLGFGYDRLLQLNPGLVICSISGFGQTGPLRDYKAFDLVAQAMTGLMTLTREPGGPPLRILIGDILTGVYGALSVASALVGRVKSGKGCVIDLSLFESLLTTFPYFAVRYLTDGELPPPIDAGQNAVPYDVFPASDGELVIAIYGDHMWPSLCRVLDLPELAADAELKTNAGRVKRSKEVVTALIGRLKAKTVAQWCEIFAAAGIPHAPILSIGAALDHPHARARGMIVGLEHQKCGTVKAVGSPIHINGAPIPGSATPGPMLGEHTEQILSELGYNSAAIARLRGTGAIGP
ncbi:crotonobetainyl-CoA:carnitine CoA-transferase CaiB-like acyl-CoA transferase [Bradyrhizobium sp. LM6.10]